MEPKIRRKFKAIPVTIGFGPLSSASAVRWDDAAGGALLMGTGATAATTIQLHCSATADGTTYGRLYNADGSAADITLAQSATDLRTYALPDACYGVGAIKFMHAQAAGTNATAIVLIKT